MPKTMFANAPGTTPARSLRIGGEAWRVVLSRERLFLNGDESIVQVDPDRHVIRLSSHVRALVSKAIGAARQNCTSRKEER